MIAADNKRHIVFFALITALCLMGDSMLYIALPVHYQEMGLSSLWEVGIILAVNRIVRLPLNPCIGWVYTRISERTGIFIAVALATATTFSYGFLPNFLFWICVRCTWGLAWGLLRLGSLFCILNLSTPENRGHCTGLYNGLYRLGSLVGMFLGGILADTVGVRMTAVIFGIATASAVFLAFFAIPKGTAPRECGAQTSLLASLRAIAKVPRTFWIVVGGGCTALIIQGAVASTLSRLISVHTDGGLDILGGFIGAATIAGFFQALRWSWEPWLAPLSGKLSDARFKRPKVLLYAFGAGSVVFLLLAAPLPLPLWFCCMLCMLLTATVLTTVTDASASDVACVSGGRALLLAYALIADVGAAFGPLLAYGVNQFFGINAVYAVCAALFFTLFVTWRPYASGDLRS